VIDPIWTLGAEDQFYLIHPQVFRLKNFSKIFVSFIVLIVIYITIRIGIVHFTNAPNAIKLFLERTRFDNLLLGGTIALMFYGFQNKIQIPTIIQEKLIIHPVTQTISVSLFIIYILYSTCINTHFYSDLVIVSLLLPIIYNLAFNANCMINIENKWLNFIGKISFSLYLSHKMIIYGILQIVNKKIFYSFFKENPYQHLLLYPVVLAVTIFAAWLIYEFVEKKVLILKEKIKP
jgi:peptidoglycan/LPS O-acetylase OafA/YrhL